MFGAILLWMFLGTIIGFGVGIFVTILYIAVYGSPELNDQIESIREKRIALHKARLELEGAKLKLAILTVWEKVTR